MPLRVERASFEDIPRAMEVERLAYAPYEHSKILFPGPFPPDAGEKRAAELQKAMEEDSTTVWFKVIDDELEGEAAKIAFAKWHVYDPKPVPKAARQFGQGCNVEACEWFFGSLAEQRDRIMGDRPYIYLHFLQTDPKHQRRGAGMMLMKWGLDEASKRGLPAYLEASPEGKALYEKVGFKVLEETNLDFSKYGASTPIQNWAMRKDYTSA